MERSEMRAWQCGKQKAEESLSVQGRVEWLWFTPTITYFIDKY